MKNTITKKTSKNLLKELKYLKNKEIPKIIKEIKSARELGDLSENNEYKTAKSKKINIENKINEIEDILLNSNVIDEEKNINKNTINFNAIITLKNTENNELKNYKIVSDDEININSGLISINSPIAKTLLGKKVNDMIKIKTIKKYKTFKIISIKY